MPRSMLVIRTLITNKAGSCRCSDRRQRRTSSPHIDHIVVKGSGACTVHGPAVDTSIINSLSCRWCRAETRTCSTTGFIEQTQGIWDSSAGTFGTQRHKASRGIQVPRTSTVVCKSKWYHQVFHGSFHLKRYAVPLNLTWVTFSATEG